MVRESKKASFIPGIEGLRTFSVIGVILFHLWPKVFAGGFAGVTVFFVISGFLMTRIILDELGQRGSFRLKRFYLRRFWRLYPAFIVMILLTITVLTLGFPEGLFGIRGTLLSNMFYVNNWYQILHSVSYFAASAHWPVFTHLWSLSVEAQFYFVWPIILIMILYAGEKKWQLSLILPTVLALLSAALFAFFYSPSSTNRAYYGTDTRVFSFIIGGIVAIFLTLLSSPYCPAILHQIQNKLNQSAVYVIPTSLLALLAIFVTANGVQAWTYYFGMLLLSILTALLIYYLIANAQSKFALIMGNHIFQYIGSRSYSIYLYQLPIMMMYEKLFPTSSLAGQFSLSCVSVITILIVADLSYRFIEMPFRHGLVWPKHPTAWNLQTILMTCLAVFSITGTALGLTSKSATRSKAADQLQHELMNSSKKIAKQNSQAANQRSKSAASSKVASSSTSRQNSSANANSKDQQMAAVFNTSSQNIQKVQSLSITAIGDSVLLDVGPDLQLAMPKTFVNAKIGRHTIDAVNVVDNLKKAGKLDNILLMMIGTNGEISPQNIQQIRQIAGSRQIYWVNSFSNGRPWEAPNNQVLATAAQHDPNLHIVDWYDGARAHREWFSPDGIHPQQAGNRAMTTMIIDTIAANTK